MSLLDERGVGTLPGLEVLEVEEGRLATRLKLREELMAPNGYLHAATIVGLPEGAQGFTTVELKTNFLGTKLSGVIGCEARLAHGGRTTQVWDATVTDAEEGRPLALFRCTQLILYPR